MKWPFALVALAVLALASPSLAKPLETTTVQNAARVLQESISLPSGIPLNLMSDAQAIAIIPDVIKLGFVVGGRRGHGVVVVRGPDGAWSNPVFITLTGGSIGYQIGVQATDVILVFRSRKSVDGVLRGEFTLGADAAVAAGPVGRQAAAGTDIQLQAEIYSYSRSRGLFAGVSLDGSVIQIDSRSNAAFYAAVAIAPYDIIAGRAPNVPAEVVFLKDLLTQHAPVAPGTTIWVDPNAAPAPVGGTASLEVTRQQLIASAGQLHSRLDENWRKYLALPDGIATADRPPSVDAVAESLKRYDTISSQSQYRPLTQRPEFQATHGLLRVYLSGLAATASLRPAGSTLPPPPAPAPARR
jgi:lipid-binding SYLF domain-containing protein